MNPSQLHGGGRRGEGGGGGGGAGGGTGRKEKGRVSDPGKAPLPHAVTRCNVSSIVVTNGSIVVSLSQGLRGVHGYHRCP